MPMPWAYRHATRDFRAFLDDLKSRADLVSDNSAYTVVDAVFQVFRRRLTVQEGLAFASILPAVLSAIFTRNWAPVADPAPFADIQDMNAEARQVRRDHNLTPENAIEVVAWCLWRHVNHRELKLALSKLPPEARAFWEVPNADPADLAQRLY
ncbi:DUF2267 domain-containing protein [Alphaproteobacteria bacterium GH1-50]|uniref:DUF2267 domain-containing protein n=1 Tax=Kangsaoukella pontilimi TaxID=2691042 RepID=A0A7C9MBJ7_9RHOB|nr:DUF2267 domain-containing protein [Kangsaoukella pontilimi]MXQ08753.1 DUF2267 domain-containing protein [Kangsaoukella pontilimi]